MSKDAQDDNDDSLSEELSRSEIKRLEKSLASLRGLLSLLLVVSLVCISSLGVWLYNINETITKQAPASVDELVAQLESTQQRLADTQTQAQQQQAAIEQLFRDFEKGAGQQDRQRIDAIKKVLVAQQKDQQRMLVTLSKGMVELANMVRGTRDWTQSYVGGLKQAKATSQQRQATLEEI